MSTTEPFFCVVRSSAIEWIIEARWPDDSTEIVETFEEYLEALKWLSTQSTAWIDQRMRLKDVG
jgi:hypothetical protein